jgi:hypothetical protein
VADLKMSGVGARSSLMVGVLSWIGTHPPTSQDVAGLAAHEQGLTNIQLFTQGGLQVVDTADVVPSGLASNFRDHEVGTRHRVWGWQAAIARVAALEV